MFKLIKTNRNSNARLGLIKTKHGRIKTPCFMPIATRGNVKSLDSKEVEKLKAQIILGNTYHLYLKPGESVIKKFGGLHRFINWNNPILTDSGGYQVFSLSKIRKITEEGVEFRSHIDGSRHILTPERSIEIQRNLNSDIIMVLDECAPYPSQKEYIKNSVKLSANWAKRCKEHFEKLKRKDRKSLKNNFTKKGSGNTKTFKANFSSKFKNIKHSLLFGIIQGGIYKDMRRESAKRTLEIDFDGYAIGGVSVGEPPKKMIDVINWTIPFLPKNKPRYLMGVGKPEEIVKSVARGIDMFDCVIPTRNARHGTLYKFKRKSEKIGISKKSWKFYDTLYLTNKKFENDKNPIDKNCKCFSCKNYSRAYIRYLFISKELLAFRLASIHNLYFYLELMKRIRNSI